jgi:hypothetical protein
MSSNADEDDLKGKFGELRAQQESDFPGFHAILARGPRRTTHVENAWIKRDGWIPGLALAAVVAAFVWIASTENPSLEEDLFVDGPSTPEPFVLGQLAVGEWSMPTDSLLDLSGLPGDGLLNELPEIGIPPIQAPDGAQNESTKRRIPA